MISSWLLPASIAACSSRTLRKTQPSESHSSEPWLTTPAGNDTNSRCNARTNSSSVLIPFRNSGRENPARPTRRRAARGLNPLQEFWEREPQEHRTQRGLQVLIPFRNSGRENQEDARRPAQGTCLNPLQEFGERERRAKSHIAGCRVLIPFRNSGRENRDNRCAYASGLVLIPFRNSGRENFSM